MVIPSITVCSSSRGRSDLLPCSIYDDEYHYCQINTVFVKELRISLTKKSLSIIQPYAELMVPGRKTIELKMEYII